MAGNIGLQGVLASIPGLGGYLAGQQNDQLAQGAAVNQAGALQGILMRQQQMQQQQQDAPLHSQILRAQIAEHEQKVKQAQIMNGLTGADLQNPDTLEKIGVALGKPEFITHAERLRAQAAQNATLGLLRGTQTEVPIPSAPDEAAAIAKLRPLSQGGGSVEVAPAGMATGTTTRNQGGIFAPLMQSEYPAISSRATQLQGLLNSPNFKGDPKVLQQEADRLTTLQANYDQQNSMAADRVANRPTTPEPPVQTHVDAKGTLWQLTRGGSWEVAKGPDGKPITSKVPTNPAAEQLYRDYANHPQVKEANDLEAKMKPLTEYMIQFQKTGQSVNANDAALAKMYLSVTTPVGSRAYTMDQKQLASLPTLGDRLGNMASSFFAGKDLTDQTRKEMFNYIIQRYKSLDTVRQSQRDMAVKRGSARGVSQEQIFGQD